MYDDTTRLAGRRSLRINKHDLRGVGFASHEVAVKPGTYTFSAFVKSTGDIWSWVEASYMDRDGVRQTAASQKIRQCEEFTRLSCTLTLPEDALRKTLTCRVMAGDAQGTAWFDCAQLETGRVANRYNMLYDGDFTGMETGEPAGWERYYGDPAHAVIAAMEPGSPGFLDGNCLRLTGQPGAKMRLVQYIDADGKAGDNYVLGGWANGQSAPLKRPSDEAIEEMAPEEKDLLRYFCLKVEFRPKNGQDTDYRPGGQADWNEEWVGWQYACAASVAPVDYDRIRVSICYENNLNRAEIGAVTLTKELYGPTYVYDEKNNVKSVTTLINEKSGMEYDEFDNLISYIQPGRDSAAKYTITYGDTDGEKKKHLPRSAVTPLGHLTETEYDPYGNATQTTTRKDGHAPFMRATTAYTADGNYAVSSTDARGKTVTTVTDPQKGLVQSVTDPAGQSVTYAYDTSNRVTEAKTVASAKEYKNAYTYENDRLKTVSHNTTGNTPDVTYTFDYDALGNQTTVKVGNQPLSTNVYTATGDKLLTRVEYGNGGQVHYAYDDFKRTKSISYDNESARFTYEYGANGAVGNVVDAELGREARVSYDTAERPVTAELLEGGKRAYHLLQRYDQFNQPSKLTEEVEGLGGLRGIYGTSCEYDVEGRPTAITYDSSQTKAPELERMGQVKYVPTETDIKGVLHVEDPENPREIYAEYTVPAPPTGLTEHPSTRKLAYAYDGLGRLTHRKLYVDDSGSGMSVLNTHYAYVSGGHGTDSETGLISWLGVGDRSLTYTYDDVGNIIRENTTLHNPSRSEMSFLDAGGARLPLYFNDPTASHLPLTAPIPGNRSYEYDKLGQLTRVNDEHAGETWTYAYDQGGNITQKERHGYTEGSLPNALETIAYTYGDPNWKDKLTAYNGKTITCDAIGNPLIYDGWAYTWKAGRMLDRMQKAGTEAQFTYDHTGLRVKKTVNGVDTLYTLNGKIVTHVRKGDTQMHFFYDAQGRLSMVRYNGVDYAYMHNLQGDIIGIMDMSGQIVVEYTYDSWGRLLHTEGVLASTLGYDNPFRYRGYVYDEETGLYLTATRYYNPEWGRWLNADMLLGEVGALFSQNSFAYCINNPVNRSDPTGLSGVGIYEQRQLFNIYGAGGSGNARIILSSGDVIMGRVDQTPEFYHFDFFPDVGSTRKDMQLVKKEAGGRYKWDPPLPIIFEVDYPTGTIRMAAVVRAYPHFMQSYVNEAGEKKRRAVLKDNYGEGTPKGTVQLCVFVLDSSTSHNDGHKSKGAYNNAVRTAAVTISQGNVRGGGGGGHHLFSIH